ncbi:MAG TPA: hypothetical protein VGL38_14735 [bacterium]|jgi:hypothetical protein
MTLLKVLAVAVLASYVGPVFALAPLRSFVAAAGAHDLCVQGHYAYVASTDAGLRIFDIGNSAAPVQVGVFDSPGSATGVAVQNGLAYVADGTSGLRIVNVSNPAAPTEVGFYDTPSLALNVAVSGNYAYVADGYSGSLRIIDVTDPAAPFEVSSVSATPYVGAFDVAVVGHFCYVPLGPRICCIDVTDPVHPVFRGWLYTYSGVVGMVARDNYVYAAVNYGFEIYNFDNPDAPTLASRWINPVASGDYDVYVSGNYLFVAYQDAGFSIFDISNPASPTYIEYSDTPGTCYGIVTAGCTAYVADNTTFRLYNISTYAPCPVPRAPEQLVIEPLENQVRLTWPAVTQDTDGAPIWPYRYTIFRSVAPDGQWDSIGVALPADSIHYTDPYVGGDRGFYQVRAVAN